MSSNLCPCGLSKNYDTCCGIYHSGAEVAPTAESLMRSRYAGFALKQYDYLFKTVDPQNLKDYNFEGNKLWAESVQFTGLEILNSEQSGNKGIVEFKVQFILNGETHTHHEVSQFRQQNGIWYYKKGTIKSNPQSEDSNG